MERHRARVGLPAGRPGAEVGLAPQGPEALHEAPQRPGVVGLERDGPLEPRDGLGRPVEVAEEIRGLVGGLRVLRPDAGRPDEQVECLLVPPFEAGGPGAQEGPLLLRKGRLRPERTFHEVPLLLSRAAKPVEPGGQPVRGQAEPGIDREGLPEFCGAVLPVGRPVGTVDAPHVVQKRLRPGRGHARDGGWPRPRYR